MTRSLLPRDGWTLRAVASAAGRAASLPLRIPASVPGTVHTDLLAAGLIDDPYLDLNERAEQWIGHTIWEYRTEVQWQPPEARDARQTDLVFEGLDTVATITLNGVEVGRTFNQHRTHRFDVTAVLQRGSNELLVRFDSAWEYAAALERELGPLPNAYPAPFNFVRKMAANFGWDWGPQLVTAGIWKEVRLETFDVARLAEVRTSVTVDHAAETEPGAGVARPSGVVQVHARLVFAAGAGYDDGGLRPHALELLVALPAHGREVRVPVAAGSTSVTAQLKVDDIDLWWPVGMGEQPLYDLSVRLVSGPEHPGAAPWAETVLDEHARRIGFRTITLDTSDDDGGSAFTIIVNETPIFVRGANWIPDDCFPSRITAARYRERVEQAVGANLNLLRVWGGGIYERDEFYDVCDELGVLVWQDFLFACAAYPEEEPLRSEVEGEARDNVVRLASHASLALLNGCNENIWGWFEWGWQEPIGDRSWGLGYYTDLLPAIVAELAPATAYWPGSPYSGSMQIGANDVEHGNIHIWDVWNKVDYSVYADYRPRFVSEFGFQGPPTWSTLERSIHDDPLAPDSPGMLAHQKADDGNGKIARGMQPHLPEPETMEQWHYLAQLNQARAIVFGIEHFRSLRPYCMGTIVWQLNDCWPVTSWAAIDGYGRRKPLWQGLRRANAERLLTVQPRADGLALVAVNDSITPWHTSVTVTRRHFDGEILATVRIEIEVDRLSAQSFMLAAGIGRPGDAGSELIVVEAADARLVTHYFAEDLALDLRDPGLEVTVAPWSNGGQTVTLASKSVARGVVFFVDRLDPEAWVDDADIDVVPGVPVRVRVFSREPLDAAHLAAAPVLHTVNEVMLDARVVR